jgi:hypothetical protein
MKTSPASGHTNGLSFKMNGGSAWPRKTKRVPRKTTKRNKPAFWLYRMYCIELSIKLLYAVTHQVAFGFGLPMPNNMPRPILRIVKWLSATPVIGVCTFCNRQFKAPMTALTKTKDAQASLQQQFDSHTCNPRDAGETSGVEKGSVFS